jgi:hypothetical protein
MPASPFVFTSAERVALDATSAVHPQLTSDLRAWLAVVLDDLTPTAQGRVVTEIEAENLLDRLPDEFVVRVLAEMEPWGEDEDLRETVVDLLAGHLLAEARERFVRRVVGATRN